MALTKRDRLRALSKKSTQVDLSIFTTEQRSQVRQMAQNYARQEVVAAHRDEYKSAYQGWLEALAEQAAREGVDAVVGTDRRG